MPDALADPDLPETFQTAVNPMGATILYVNPAGGSDDPSRGAQNSPLRTITFALRQAQPGTIVQLARGSYTKDSGEQFPLVVPAGVTLKGDEGSKGEVVAITAVFTATEYSLIWRMLDLLGFPGLALYLILFRCPHCQGRNS